jgi:hypothetical protein
MTENGPLREALEAAMVETGASMADLTILAKDNDPFRFDVPGKHRLGAWLAMHLDQLAPGRRIHLRGIHYLLVTAQVTKPNGELYTNTDRNWRWLCDYPADAARWLGYVPFDRIIDQRNDAPTVQISERRVDPRPGLSCGTDDLPDESDLDPYVWASDFDGVQPYRLVIIGEKSSLEPVLGPVAARFGADLYLPTGTMSDTLIHNIARVGDDDGRRMVVFYFADADPSGWNMAIEVSRKLQAFQHLLFPDLDFEVHRVGLTPEQVRANRLPSTPLKETEQRSDRWREAMGTEQTEIDALAALQPAVLRQMAVDALSSFYDATLEQRVREARDDWRQEAQAAVDDNLDQDVIEEIEEAKAVLGQLRRYNDDLRQLDVDDFDLPDIEVPEAEVDEAWQATPLLDSDWPFAEQCRALKRDRSYAVEDDD